jgi:hypothetical protein
MVIGRDCGESAVSGGIDGRLQLSQGERLLAELHQRQMDAEIHPPMLSALRSTLGGCVELAQMEQNRYGERGAVLQRTRF